MKLFDYFRKNKKQENHDVIKESADLKQPQVKPTRDMYDGLSVDGEYLKLVYSSNIQNGVFIVPKHIKAIDMHAFSRLKELKKVVMHDGVRFIAPKAFYNCENLTEVSGLENAETMKSFGGFENCTNLQSVKISETVGLIRERAFIGCKNLRSINLPEGLWGISDRAFAGCENLESIDIPAGVEIISTEAFAGCKNLTVTFLDDDKKYLEDIIKEQKEIESQYLEEVPDLEEYLEESEDEMPKISDEDKEALYNEMGIKYRRMNILGKEILWTTGKIIIKQDALAGVKEVVAYNKETIKTIMKSGYKGKITLVNKENQTSVTIDIPAMEKNKKEQITAERESYYKQFLIPTGGTFNWLINCEKNNYKGSGYKGITVCEIPISFDSRIVVEDNVQPKTSITSYEKEYEEFFTDVTFYKKEFDNYSVYAPYEYERAYSVYYPFGARFDKQILLQLGTALSGLIDKARDLPNTEESENEILKIQSVQKELLDLFINGTNNKNAVLEITKDIKFPRPTNEIKVARYKKDWLPYFTNPLFSEFDELKEYRKAKKNNEDTSSK